MNTINMSQARSLYRQSNLGNHPDWSFRRWAHEFLRRGERKPVGKLAQILA